ncbi:hypothetical protein Tco_0743843 [Tanacetum coccineum]
MPFSRPSGILEKICVLRRRQRAEQLPSEQLEQKIPQNHTLFLCLDDFLAKWFVDEFPDVESVELMKVLTKLILLSISVQIDEVGRMCAYLTDQHSERMTLLLHVPDDDGSVLSIACGCNSSTQKNKGSLEAERIVRAASTRVRFRLLTKLFCSGVRGVEV